MAQVDAGAVLTVLIQNGPEVLAIGEAVAKDIPAIAGLFRKTTAPDGTTLTADQVAALVKDTDAVDDAVQQTADAEIATAHTQLKAGGIVALVLGLLLTAAAAHAQVITSYTLRIYNVGAPAPVSTTPLPAANFVCNQTAPAVPATVANPARFFIDDVANAGKVCIYTDTGTGPLLSLPFAPAPMNATITATNSAATSGESVASNSFTRPGVAPPVPTGARVAP